MGRRIDAVRDLFVAMVVVALLTPFIIINLAANRGKKGVVRPPLITKSVINRLSLSLSIMLFVIIMVIIFTTAFTTMVLRLFGGG